MVLKGFESGYTHMLNHDLESIYYIAYWHVVGYHGYRLPAKDFHPLNGWCIGSYEDMYQAKEKHMCELPGGKSDLLNTLNRDTNSIDAVYCIQGLFQERSDTVSDFVKAHKRKARNDINLVRK